MFGFVLLGVDLIHYVLSFFFLFSVDQLACLGELRSLSELTLDGNPVALETWYKQAVLRCVLHLRQLDMKRITVSLCVFMRDKSWYLDSLLILPLAVKFSSTFSQIFIPLISTNLGQGT